ncbi:hypothetical protein TW95_gp0325 [Pandoravirus inopinatum]|uniref:Uncharacterized protein n=1 Tax=Pandoravirus inopinatum TaxID=1605721 RepID=A0A0B5J0R6_9VIRU|nr:hypothetical protein TW95_gp0325 [Pandoravirus inopinatum]AJF97059.1 hypothetical protein [Pandoravirus inopinatum]
MAKSLHGKHIPLPLFIVFARPNPFSFFFLIGALNHFCLCHLSAPPCAFCVLAVLFFPYVFQIVVGTPNRLPFYSRVDGGPATKYIVWNVYFIGSLKKKKNGRASVRHQGRAR